MDWWGSLITKISTECGALGLAGWVLFGLTTFRLVHSEDKREKLQDRMLDDAILAKKAAEAVATAQRELVHTVTERRSRARG